MQARISITGLYNWDNTLFDLLNLPEGIDKDVVIATILSECSDLEILYPNPVVMKNLIAVWSRAEEYKWKTLYNSTILEYNPIDNYDRTETRTLESEAKGTSKDSGNDINNTTDSGTDTGSLDSTNTSQVAAFDSASGTMADKEKNIIHSENETNYGKKTTNKIEYGHENENSYNKNDTETIRARGNIGVTTTQQMMEQERNIADFNLYDVITKDFKQRFCLLVY